MYNVIMKLFKIFAGISTAYSLFRLLQSILNRYAFGIYYVDKEEEKALQEASVYNADASIDLRGTPTHQCVCGSHVWNLQAVFEDYEIATYYLDMQCVECGSIATAPTPIDKGV